MYDRGWIRQAPRGLGKALPLFLATVLLLPGCSVLVPRREPALPTSEAARGDDRTAVEAPTPALAEEPPSIESARQPPAADAPDPVDEFRADLNAEPSSDEPMGLPEPPLVDPLLEELAADETLTPAPLDDLANVEPDPTEEALEQARKAAAEPPSFDIPIVTNDRVLAWVDIYSNRYKRSTETTLARSGRYLERFRRIFREEGVPEDLVYMAHVESGYKTSAYSRAHARGIFQFMSATARHYGLRVDYWVDERADPDRSARASARYMKRLYDEFQDWHLAIAAYNAGEGKIRRALRRSGKDDFWGIARTNYIRRETKNHVPAVLAATLLSKQPEKYGLVYVPDPPLEYDTIEVTGAADLQVLARCAGTDFQTLKRLNPALRRNQTPPKGTQTVHVPAGSAKSTLTALNRIPPNERVMYLRHRVRAGESLSVIARRYGTSIRGIQQANGMGRRTTIHTGRSIKIPTASARGTVAPVEISSAPAGQPLTHRVRRGDTLYALSRQHRTTPSAIAAASGISVQKKLQIGEKLTIVPGVSRPAEAERLSSRESKSQIHVVRRGDSLWRIANLYQTTVNTLCALNKISPKTILRPGRKLTVRTH